MLSQTKKTASKQAEIKMIIGLGNPGKEYKKTYHNIGFLFLEFMSGLKENDFVCFKGKNFDQAEFKNYILIKPNTFMNNSGIGVWEALKFFKLNKDEVIIVHDDSDLKLGTYKIADNSSSAGHHGIDSIIKQFKSKNFKRLRIGIRPNEKAKASDFVLKKISNANMKILENVFKKAEKEI